MITVYGFGPMFGVPDPSAFVVKTCVHLTMAGRPYKLVRTNPSKAPKNKLPYIEDNGRIIADSTFIRDYIEKTYDVDLDVEFGKEARAQAWAAERLAEDHLYWASLYDRWMDDANFAKGPAQFFEGLPKDRRATVREKGRATMIQTIAGQGLGRHSAEEMLYLAGRSLAALSAILGDKPYLMGARPCGADASVFGQLIQLQTPYFDTSLSAKARSFPNLMGYTARMMREYFPDFR